MAFKIKNNLISSQHFSNQTKIFLLVLSILISISISLYLSQQITQNNIIVNNFINDRVEDSHRFNVLLRNNRMHPYDAKINAELLEILSEIQIKNSKNSSFSKKIQSRLIKFANQNNIAVLKNQSNIQLFEQIYNSIYYCFLENEKKHLSLVIDKITKISKDSLELELSIINFINSKDRRFKNFGKQISKEKLNNFHGQISNIEVEVIHPIKQEYSKINLK